MATANDQHVISVSAGGGEPPAMKITPGSEVGPISLGTEGAWRVVAPGVAPKHAYLFFDGQRLFLQSLNPGTPALVDGKPIPDEWTELGAPCEIALGEARLTFAAMDDAPMESSRNVPVPTPSGTGTGPAAPPSDSRPFAPGAFSKRDDSEVTRLDDLIVPSGRGPAPPVGPTPAAVPPPGGGAEEEPEIATRVHSPLFPGGPGGLGLPAHMMPPGFDGSGLAGPSPAAGRPAIAPVFGQAPVALHPPEGMLNAPGGPRVQMPVTPPGAFSPLRPPVHPEASPEGSVLQVAKPKGWWGRQPFPRKLIFMMAPLLLALGVVMKVPALKAKLLPGVGAKPTTSATTSPSGSAPAVPTDTSAIAPPELAAGGAAAENAGGAADAASDTDTDTGTDTADTAVAAAPPPPPPRWGAPTKASKSTERLATDALASGDFHKAADLYDELAAKFPDNPVYQEAAEIVRAKAGPAPR